MSTPRIGPPGSPIVPADAHTGEPLRQTAKAAAAAPDHVTHQGVPKVTDPRPQQATTLAFDPPHQPERRAFLGGERGAWAPAVRDAILRIADSPIVGRALLEAFNRGAA